MNTKATRFVILKGVSTLVVGSLIGPAVLGGCASHPSPSARAYQEQKREADAAEKQRIVSNWSKLRVGMTIDEVDAAIGPLSDLYSVKRSIELLSNFGSYGFASASATYNGGFFTLKFNSESKLIEFR